MSHTSIHSSSVLYQSNSCGESVRETPPVTRSGSKKLETQRRLDLRGFHRTAPPSTPRPSSFRLLMPGVLLCSLKTSLTLTQNPSLKPLHGRNTVLGGTWVPINRPDVRKILHRISCLFWLCWNYDCQFRIWNAHDCTKTVLA